jgi:Helicase associated domain
MTSSSDNDNSLWEDSKSAVEIINNVTHLNDEHEAETKGIDSDPNVTIATGESQSTKVNETATLQTSTFPDVTPPSQLLDASTEEHSDLNHKRKASADVNEDSSFSAMEAANAIVNDATQGLEKTVGQPLENTPKKRVRRIVPARISWEDRIASLKAYKDEHGDLNIPIRYKKNPSLGKFVHNTREQYKLFHHQCKPGYQKRCCLTAERIAMLNELGFLWTTERVQKQNDDWAMRLEQLKEYKAKHGVRILTCIDAVEHLS